MTSPSVSVPAGHFFHGWSKQFSALAPLGAAKIPTMPGASSIRVAYKKPGRADRVEGISARLVVPAHHSPTQLYLYFMSDDKGVHLYHILQKNLFINAVDDASDGPTTRAMAAYFVYEYPEPMDVTVEATQDEVVVNVLGHPADQGRAKLRAAFKRQDVLCVTELLGDPEVIEDSEDGELSPRTKKVLELYDELGNAAEVTPLVQMFEHSSYPTIKRIIARHRGRDA